MNRETRLFAAHSRLVSLVSSRHIVVCASHSESAVGWCFHPTRPHAHARSYTHTSGQCGPCGHDALAFCTLLLDHLVLDQGHPGPLCRRRRRGQLGRWTRPRLLLHVGWHARTHASGGRQPRVPRAARPARRKHPWTGQAKPAWTGPKLPWGGHPPAVT